MPTHTLTPGSTSAAAKNKQEKTKMLCWQKTDLTLFFVILVNIKKQATFHGQYKSTGVAAVPTHTLTPGSTSAAAKNKQEKTKMVC